MRRFESARGLLSALLPALLLLCWSGIAATAITGFIAAPLLGQPFAGLALSARTTSTARALWHGAVLYPLAYGLGFAALGQATVITGAALGTLHAALLALLTLRRGGGQLLRASLPRMLLFAIYGSVLGFAFVTP